jgi:hypothetical protein
LIEKISENNRIGRIEVLLKGRIEVLLMGRIEVLLKGHISLLKCW